MMVISLDDDGSEAEDEPPAWSEEGPPGRVQVEEATEPPPPVVKEAQEEPPVPIQEDEAPEEKELYYSCPYCLFSCHDKANKNVHKNCHNKYQTRKDKVCGICLESSFPTKAYKTTQQNLLNYHIETHH